MSPPIVGSYSPANNNLCDQNVSSTLDSLSQDLQQAPMSPMSPMSASQQQGAQPVLQSNAQQNSQNQMNDINMVEPIGVPLQQGIIDPYRRAGVFDESKSLNLYFNEKSTNKKEKLTRNLCSFTGVENTELYRNNVSNNSYGMQSHSSNLMNGHHHDMQLNSFGQPNVSNGYNMNLKQEPDVNF